MKIIYCPRCGAEKQYDIMSDLLDNPICPKCDYYIPKEKLVELSEIEEQS